MINVEYSRTRIINETGKLQILIAEYEALRREIELLIEHQKEIMHFSILGFAAMIGLLGVLGNNKNFQNLSYVYLLFPWFFLLLTLLYADKTVRILRAADYIHNYLRKNTVELSGMNEKYFWQWELYKSRSKFKKELALALDRSRWLIFIFPIFLSFALIFILCDNMDETTALFQLINFYGVMISIFVITLWVILPLEETKPIGNRKTEDLTE